MVNKKYTKTKKFNLLQQKNSLRIDFPDSECYHTKKALFWSGKIKPTHFSKTYTVNLEYSIFGKPNVWVFGDELEQLDNPDFPHKFRVDEDEKRVKMCLYRYLHEFSSEKLLSKTVIPWAVEWLYFYEVWLATGEWFGGGEHPVSEETKEDETEKEKR